MNCDGGGGVYYLLSRSLGPEFGGSIGLFFFLCTVIGTGMNVLGFVEPLIANFGDTSGTVYQVLPEGSVRY
jgi:potassium/chloride transporter 9